MIEMLRIYSKGFLENRTIEAMTPWAYTIPLVCPPLSFPQKNTKDEKGKVIQKTAWILPVPSFLFHRLSSLDLWKSTRTG
jgi:hypothetical protein